MSRHLGFAFLLVACLALSLGVASASPAAVDSGPSDPVRDVSIVDVVPENRSELTGVHTVEVGSTLLVRGATNRRDDRTAIDVTVTDGPDADRIGFATVDSWGFDGVWTARLPIPETVTPGTYTLRVQTDSETDYQEFEVVAEKRATLTVRSAAADAVVVNATLPDGGYVELRDGDTVVGTSSYLAPGAHERITVPVDGAPTTLTAVAVVGTPDRRLDPYTVDGTTVTAPVRVETPTATATPTASPTPTPTPTATPSPSPSSTAASGPGFAPLAAVVALLIAGFRLCRRR